MAQKTAGTGPDQPLPGVSDFDVGERVPYPELLQGVIESLKICGGCLLRNFISQETVNELNNDFVPYFDKAEPLKSTEYLFHVYDRSEQPRLIPCCFCTSKVISGPKRQGASLGAWASRTPTLSKWLEMSCGKTWAVISSLVHCTGG
jgi:hypothetical protein